MYKLTVIDGDLGKEFLAFCSNSKQSILDKINQELKNDIEYAVEKYKINVNIIDEFFNSERDRIELDYEGSCKYILTKS